MGGGRRHKPVFHQSLTNLFEFLFSTVCSIKKKKEFRILNIDFFNLSNYLHKQYIQKIRKLFI